MDAPLTKSQLVEQIRRLNASAPREWLEAFDFRALEGYLGRLREAVADASFPAGAREPQGAVLGSVA
jgi:hypothetical protein